MKATELREKSTAELNQLLLQHTKEQFKMRMERGLAEAPKVGNFRQLRREVARIHTILNERSGKHE